MMKKLLMVAVSALCAGGSFTSSAEVITWTGAAGDHYWETKGNWDLGRIPNVATDHIVIGPFESPYIVTNKTAKLAFSSSLTVCKNATLHFWGGWTSWTVDAGAKLTLSDGNLIWTKPPEYDWGANFILNRGAILEMSGDSQMYGWGSGSTFYQNPAWKCKGGKVNSGSKYYFEGDSVLNGAIYRVQHVEPADNASVHVLNLAAGAVISAGYGTYDGSNRLWVKADFPGSYINFPRYSVGRYVVVSENMSSNEVFETYFKGNETTARMRFNGQVIATQEEFDRCMTVFYDADNGGTSIQAVPEAADEIIVVDRSVYEGTYDGRAYAALDISVAYPRSDYTLEYSVGNSGTWSEEVPLLMNAGTYTIHARVTDLTGALATWTKDYTAVVHPKSLETEAVFARIEDQQATGEDIEPETTVTDRRLGATVTLVRDEEYEVTYSDNRAVGIATATATGIGNYCGSIAQTFRINPKALDGDVYVDAAAPSGGDGSSWEKAISSAEIAGEIVKAGNAIHIRAGIYRLQRELLIDGKDGVSIVGDGARTTILAYADGYSGRVLDITGSRGVTISGVTVRGGVAEVENANADGGGIRLVECADAVINSCRIIGNGCRTTGSAAVGYPRGGGIFVSGGSLTVVNSIIARNWLDAHAKYPSYTYGAGFYMEKADVTMLDSEIDQNYTSYIDRVAPVGGGIYAVGRDGSEYATLTLQRCLVARNTAQFLGLQSNDGDGITCGERINLFLEDVTIADNGRTAPVKPGAAVCGVGVSCRFRTSYRGITNVVICGHDKANFSTSGGTEKSSNVVTTATFTGHYVSDAEAGYKGTCTLAAEALRTVFVDPTGGSDAASGAEGAPLKTLTEAANRVVAEGEIETINLGAGTYSASNGEQFPIVFGFCAGLSIVGAGSGLSVLDGESRSAIRFLCLDNCANVSISGLGFRDLSATGTLGYAFPEERVQGGGVMVKDSKGVEVRNCEFRGIAFDLGGDYYSAQGGGLGFVRSQGEVSGCNFVANSCRCIGREGVADGGGLGFCKDSSGLVRDCAFSGNVLLGCVNAAWGGGFCAAGTGVSGSGLTVTENGFTCNGFGGGLYVGGGEWSGLRVTCNRQSGLVGAGTIVDSTVVDNTIDLFAHGTLGVSNTTCGVVSDCVDLGGNTFGARGEAMAAADVYVNPAAAAGGDGSQARPFRTLGAAVAACTGATVIHLAEGTYAEEESIDCTGLRNVRVEGAGADRTVFDFAGRATGRFATVTDAVDLEFKDFSVRNLAVKTSTDTAALFLIGGASAAIRLTSLQFSDCVQTNTGLAAWTTYYGGAVSADKGVGVSIVGCGFDNCHWSCNSQASAFRLGGIIGARSAGLFIDRSTFNRGHVYSSESTKPDYEEYRCGGAISIDDGLTVIRSSAFTSNNVYFAEDVFGKGDAVYYRYVSGAGYIGGCRIENSLFKDNGNLHGAAIFRNSDKNRLFVANTVFLGTAPHFEQKGTALTTFTASHNAATPETGATAWQAKDASLVPLAADAQVFEESPKGGRRFVPCVDSGLVDAGENLVWQTADLDLNGDPRRVGYFKRKVSIADIGPSEHPRLIPGLMLMVW